MGYQKFVCPECGGKFYDERDQSLAIYSPVHRIPKCPRPECDGKRLSPKRFVKNKPDDCSPLDALAFSRSRRSVNDIDYQIKKEEDDESDVEEDDEDDEDFLPPARDFNLAMRYHGGTHAVRQIIPKITHVANSSWTKIGMPAGRANTNDVMGKAINGKGKLTAQAHAGRGVPYKKDKFNSYEWCHLVADSLGGPTSAGNLVSASYGANTFMAVIESKIQRNNSIDVKVKVLCSAAYVGEIITYKLRPTGDTDKSKQLKFEIDATCQDFCKGDADQYGKLVTDWIKKYGLTKSN